MKKFKTLDYQISLLLIIGFSIASLLLRNSIFIAGYFTVGSWQVISMIIHAKNGWFTNKGGARYIYHWVTLVSLITFPIGSFFILLFTAPVMAIYYNWLCYHEVKFKMQRPLALLK